MDHLAVLATLAAIHLAWNFGPGPNVVLVAHVAARESRAGGFKAALGLTTGAALWAGAAAIGLGVLSALEWLQQTLRLAGAAYLVWLGIELWRNSGAASLATAPAVTAPGWRPFRLGVMANLGNPISLVFFTGMFAAILPPGLPAWVRAAAVLVIAADALAWYTILALVFSSYWRSSPHTGARLLLAAGAARLRSRAALDRPHCRRFDDRLRRASRCHDAVARRESSHRRSFHQGCARISTPSSALLSVVASAQERLSDSREGPQRGSPLLGLSIGPWPMGRAHAVWPAC